MTVRASCGRGLRAGWWGRVGGERRRRCLGRPGVLDQDLAVNVGEGDGAGVPDRDDRGGGQVAVDQERDATDVDGAVAADGQLALSGGTDRFCRRTRRRAVVSC